MLSINHIGWKNVCGRLSFGQVTCFWFCLYQILKNRNLLVHLWLHMSWDSPPPLILCFCTNSPLDFYTGMFYTMFPSYQIAIAPFQFSYRIGLLFPLEHIFFGMIFITEKGCNAPILKVIRGVSDSYRSALKT